MDYKATVIKNQDIKWKHPKIEYIEDGKVDMILTIPLTGILELQAFRSFAAGAKAVFTFFQDNQNRSIEEVKELLKPKMVGWGLMLPPRKRKHKAN